MVPQDDDDLLDDDILRRAFHSHSFTCSIYELQHSLSPLHANDIVNEDLLHHETCIRFEGCFASYSFSQRTAIFQGQIGRSDTQIYVVCIKLGKSFWYLLRHSLSLLDLLLPEWLSGSENSLTSFYSSCVVVDILPSFGHY
jgi:hypothetical protein